jgi:hypothetical protein
MPRIVPFERILIDRIGKRSKRRRTDSVGGRMTTISHEYLELQKELHRNPRYGIASLSYAPLVKKVIDETKSRSVSDYGAGKCNLKVGLESAGIGEFDYFPYDPAFPEYGAPTSADLVCCIDVLEHIEPELLDNVLRDLEQITVKFGFFTIATGPAEKFLSDGRNAHLIQKPTSWWLPKLVRYFEIEQLQRRDEHGFWIKVTPIRP